MGAMVVAPLLKLNKTMTSTRFITTQGQERGVLFRELSYQGITRKYAIIVPRNYDGATATPAILFLHGSGESGTDGSRQLLVGLAPAMLADPERWPAIAIFPQLEQNADTNRQWLDDDAAIMAMLDITRKEFNIDPKRIYLTGLSRGGAGTWSLGSKHADTFAALMPISGYGDPAALAPGLVKIPIWAFHGLKDDVVTADKTRAIVDAINAINAANSVTAADSSVKATYLPEANHNAWDPAYRDPLTPAWLFEQKKK